MNLRLLIGTTVFCLASSVLAHNDHKKEVAAKVNEVLPGVLAKIDSGIEKAVADQKHDLSFTPLELGIQTNRYSIEPGGRFRSTKLVQIVASGAVETFNAVSGNEWFTDKSKPGWRSISWTFVPVEKDSIADVEEVPVGLLMKVAKHLESRKIKYQPCYKTSTTNPKSSTVGDAATVKICLSW